ncbi:MAG: TIGR03560 family F420-dependent LLM class oxidoreductase [Acidimicrobiales bacterium]
MRLPDPCLVVLVGPAASGKSTWAGGWFRPEQIVSSDRLRALVGTGEKDQRASKAAFEVLDLVVDHRLRRGLTTVVDSTALEAARRRVYLDLARRHAIPAVAVVFDVPERELRRRNRQREGAVPAAALTAHLRSFADVQTLISDEGFAAVVEPGEVILVPPHLVAAPAAARRQQEDPMPLTFGLLVNRFTWPGGAAEIGARLGTIAAEAEEAGFESIWVMDHYLQIPQVGREWEEMLEAYTTLGFLAGRTRTARLGTLCTGITYRNIAALGKIVATLDVLSGGRALAGLGAAWFEREHRVYGWEFPPVRRRYEMLEDALQLLPMLWGKGSPPFEGRTITVPEAICYPRPLQDRIPILVGGSGERKTLRLVARYADACNLFGEADTVRHKIDVLHRHCADVDRDPAEITVTNLSTAQVIPPGAERNHRQAATVEEHIGRYRAYAEAGVQTAIVTVQYAAEGGIGRFVPVIDAFR